MDLKEYFAYRDRVGVQESELMDAEKNIAVITIDGNVIGGYYTYSFVKVKEYVKEPQRAQDGTLSNLDAYTTFTTPKVRIKFNALSIEGYRKLMTLILAKNEFDVGCYDFTYTDENHPNGRWVHQNMYFYPNDYPEIFQYDLDVLAVMNYEIELIGTNTDNEEITITLNENKPYTDDTQNAKYNITAFQNQNTAISFPFSNREITVQNIDYTFDHWNTKADGNGVTYYDGDEIAFSANTTLYAIWSSAKVNVLFVLYNDIYSEDVPQTSRIAMEKGVKFSTANTPQYGVSIGTTTTEISNGSTTNPILIDNKQVTAMTGDIVLYGGNKYMWGGAKWIAHPFEFTGWFKDYDVSTDTYTNSIYGLFPINLGEMGSLVGTLYVAYGRYRYTGNNSSN